MKISTYAGKVDISRADIDFTKSDQAVQELIAQSEEENDED